MGEQPGNFAQRRSLQPLNELHEDDLDYLYMESRVERLKPRTLITAEPDKLIYLLEGEVSLLSGGFVTETFTHLEARALQPLFNEHLDEDAAVLTSYGEILEVDRALFDALWSQARAQTVETSQLDLSEAENALFQHLLRAFMNKKLDLPALPEAALKIRKAIKNPEVGCSEITQIVQTDPVLSARLVRVANSPLYGTWREIRTVRDAVRRLGLETTKNLSFSLSVKSLFSARTRLIRSFITDLYAQSVTIAAIAYVIAVNRTPHLDPEQALLCGLIQNLGLIPILKYVDEHPSRLQSLEMLGKSFDNLKVPVSTLIFNEWNFDPEFLEIVEQAENWTRDSGEEADYVDVLIAARLIYLHDRDQSPVQFLNELPVINKLDLLEFDDDGQFFLDKARQEIEDMQRLLQRS